LIALVNEGEGRSDSVSTPSPEAVGSLSDPEEQATAVKAKSELNPMYSSLFIILFYSRYILTIYSFILETIRLQR
jgi:hypothetical protein